MRNLQCVAILLILFSLIFVGCKQGKKVKGGSLNVLTGTINLQTPHGPYNVGVISMNFADSTRSEVADIDTSKKRELYTQIWYPTEDTGSPAHYLGHPSRVEGFRQMENETWINRFESIKTNSINQAKIATSHENYPVVFFSAGFGLSKNYNTMFLEGLASHGFIVVAIDLPYVNPLVTESEEIIDPTGSFWDSFPMTKGIEDYEDGQKKFDFTYEYFTKDYEFIYNQLKSLKNHHIIGEALDFDRVASIGHSAGSVPTFGLMMKEKTPFTAFIVYDVNLHANYVSESMFFPKANRTSSPICLFMLEYSWLPPQDFVNSLSAELSIFSFIGTNHNSITDLDYIKHTDLGNKESAEAALVNLNKIISGTVFFLTEYLK